jgi:hypothetical protein
MNGQEQLVELKQYLQKESINEHIKIAIYLMNRKDDNKLVVQIGHKQEIPI